MSCTARRVALAATTANGSRKARAASKASTSSIVLELPILSQRLQQAGARGCAENCRRRSQSFSLRLPRGLGRGGGVTPTRHYPTNALCRRRASRAVRNTGRQRGATLREQGGRLCPRAACPGLRACFPSARSGRPGTRQVCWQPGVRAQHACVQQYLTPRWDAGKCGDGLAVSLEPWALDPPGLPHATAVLSFKRRQQEASVMSGPQAGRRLAAQAIRPRSTA
jgi:hypothetical protein